MTASMSDVSLLWLQDNSALPKAGTLLSCLMCGKPFLMQIYAGVPDQICPECYVTYRDCASLCCVKCRVVVAKVKPGVGETGFYTRPRTVLHIDRCNICDPDVTESVIIEVDEWYRRVGKDRKLILPLKLTKEIKP